MQGNIKTLKDDDGYLYPITLAKSVFIEKDKALDQKIFEIEDGLKNNEGIRLLTDIDLTTNPLLDNSVLGYYTDGKWRPLELRGTYTIELDRWGIDNTITDYADITKSKSNSGGINDALKWASKMGYIEVKLPPGDYLINEYAPIIPQSFMTFNLGGSRLRIRENDQEAYSVIQIGNDQKFVRITNGIIEGDKDNHNYIADGIGADTHEGGRGIYMNGNSTFVSIDNLDIFNFTGDSLTLLPTPNWQFTMDASYWESGTLSTTNGSVASSSSRIRTKNYIDITGTAYTKYGYLGIYGNAWGDFGSQINTEVFDVFFYDTNKVLLKTLRANFFDDILIPKGSCYVKFSLYQGTLPDSAVGDSSVLTLAVSLMNRWTFIEKCKLHDNKRCGIAGGGKHVFLRDSDIYQIRGIAPGTVLDIEDGYGANQYWFISGNRMYDSKVGLTFVSTKHVTVKDNEFRNVAPGTVWDECENVIFEGNRWFSSQIDLRGDVTFIGEQAHNSQFIFNKKGRQIAEGCFFKNSSVTVQKDLPFTAQINNCRFLATTEVSTNAFSYTSQPQTISNCIFEGYPSTGASMFSGIGCNDWVFLDCTFLNLDNGSGNTYLLPGGRYDGCVFNNVASLNIPNMSNFAIEFANCIFMNNTRPIVMNATNGFIVDTVRFQNCKINGVDSALINGNGIRGTIELKNNVINFTAASAIASLVNLSGSTLQYTLNNIIFDGNRITSNKSFELIGIDQNVDITNKLVVNNFFNGISPTYTLPGYIRYNNFNNGVLDPHLIGTATPSTGYYKQGEIIKDSNMATSGFLGWVCSQSGIVDTYSTWVASKFYNQNIRITDNGYVYVSMNWNGKTSPTKPTLSTTLYSQTRDNAGIPIWTPNTSYPVGSVVFPTSGNSNGSYWECTASTGSSGPTEPTWNTTTTDGGVTWTARTVQVWKCLGPVAQFKRFGALS